LQESLSIYIHIPFCSTKCSYCAFNTYTHLEYLIPEFLGALEAEIRQAGQNNPYPLVHTIFFGGGTPSLLSVSQVEQVLNAVYDAFNVSQVAEITMEANPNDLVSSTVLRGLRSLGINRLSIGMQSSNADELALFERRHDDMMTQQAVHAARRAGFDNINLDLIYGFPHQSMTSWQSSLEAAHCLAPEHFSLYALGLEDGTPLYHRVQSHVLEMPQDDLIADMYDYASDFLEASGYEQYEISNWSRPGFACQHNTQYWRNRPYLGFGPGAHGFANGIRYETVRGPKQYIQAMTEQSDDIEFPLTSAAYAWQRPDQKDEVAETLITNLRLLLEGVDRASFKNRFGFDLLETHGDILGKHEAYGLLHVTDEAVRLTRQGRLLSNYIFRDFV
jgi:oxygen-independent coproporphyrinogen-3 oxidase